MPPSPASQPPKQAVILAGGRGERLRPLTDTMPKPLVPFHGRPFLEYLVEMAVEQGIERILMLLGYLPGAIRDHFGDGRRWGVQIDYSVTPEADETGRRLRDVRDRLDPVFLLLYCDNYWPMDLAAMSEAFAASGAAAQITIYRNAEGFTRNNVAVSDAGLVTHYDRSRTAPGLAGVDIGFGIIARKLVEGLPDDNVSFEGHLYARLAGNGQLGAFVTGHRYYSIGKPDRLAATEIFLARQPTVFLDRDGVLNKRLPKARYVRSWNEWEWLAGAREALRDLNAAGVRTIVITNQAGIARGIMSEADVAAIHARMTEEARAAGGDIAAVYHCPHYWDDGCDCRKPKPGMLFAAGRDHHIDLSRAAMAGDEDRDREAGAAAGCRPFLVSAEAPLGALIPQLIESVTRP